jgi:uncharacterized protein (TIRG00374 family)
LKVLKFIAFLTLGIVIFWLVYKDQDINRIKTILKNDVDYRWIIFSLFLGLLSHLSRTLRWNLMIEPLGKKPRILNTFLAVMVGYLMNFVLPRMGEISRCGVLSRYEKISFTKLIGTVVTERLIDMVMLLLMLVIVVFTQFGKVLHFIKKNPGVKEKLYEIVLSPYLLIGLVFILLIVWVCRGRIKETRIFKRFAELLKQFAEGFRSIKNMKNKWAFVAHSVFIWLMYYLMLYVVFFAFGFTSGLSATAGLTTFVIGSFGMVAPVQGGIGAWHFMTIEALTLYGIEKADGTVFALLSHSSTTAMLIVMGLAALLILPFINRQAE